MSELLVDTHANFSKAHCLLSQAIAGLNGMQLGDKKLLVQRASCRLQEHHTGEGKCELLIYWM